MRTWLVLGNGPMTARELEIIGILPVDCSSETKPQCPGTAGQGKQKGLFSFGGGVLEYLCAVN